MVLKVYEYRIGFILLIPLPEKTVNTIFSLNFIGLHLQICVAIANLTESGTTSPVYQWYVP